MSEKNFRIRTNVNDDKVVHVNLTQDVDFLEILSLKINQKDTYKLHVSNYGVIVGRVQANENFGIPNAKVSIFIELTDEDAKNSDFLNIYPYKEVHDKDSKGRRYNLLPDTTNNECYRVVGTFPNKRLVLDNDTQIEVFDKYWKYTTVTNKSGDYMIFGVPSGSHNIHVDIDLSDIGILSQKPIDFTYKGYNITQFDNARQFKESTNLNNLSQILSQDNAVHVYPFWGDTNVEEIAISRCDIQVQYKFESTCVFFGSIVSDDFSNNIGHGCSPSKHIGFNRKLVTGEGTIEMIRKTPDNLVEEFQIQGNRLIDGDGVWCYQIPMNLDYVGTDEFGNIVPTDDVKKGIATRTSVRFRVSMQETNNEGVSRHRAKYLIPNVQKVSEGRNGDNPRMPHIEKGSEFENCYEFGSATPDEYFRDLYWNKVYSIKNYIPRIQNGGRKNTQNYSGIRTVNSNNNLNPVPFNHGRFKIVFAYRVLCMVMTIMISIACIVNTLFSALACLCIGIWKFKVCPFRPIVPDCIGFDSGLTEDDDSKVEYFPCCLKCGEMTCKNPGCVKENDPKELVDRVQQTLSQEYDIVNLDFYNDWLNGCLYLPLWFWKKTKKKKFLFGLFHKRAVNTFCGCQNHYKDLMVTQNCSLSYKEVGINEDDYQENGNIGYDYDEGEKNNEEFRKKKHYQFPSNSPKTYYGVIKEFTNRAGLKIYYYAPGLPNINGYQNIKDPVSYVRLFSTDIILLGSLNDCDLDNYPNVFTNLPSTTANIPAIATIKNYTTDGDKNKGYIEVTGMDWENTGHKHKPKYGNGLLMDLACNYITTITKTCVNLERLSELGVTLDTQEDNPYPKSGTLQYTSREADGMITRYEIKDNETRAMFASLNNNGFEEKVFNPNTGYDTYKLRYIYPTDFDGHMVDASRFTSSMKNKTYDIKDINYLEYRFGPNRKRLYYSKENGNSFSLPLFNNSFYFYFGLNEGNTAIDKFNKNYYATCYSNNKYPFTITFKTSPAKWCTHENNLSTDYGTIDLNINGIKIPYSYKVYDEFKNEIFKEDNMSIEDLKFGYKVDEKGGKYKLNDDGKGNKTYVKYGLFQYFNSGKDVKPKTYVDNGVYYVEIIDAMGNSLTQRINLEQSPISINYKATPLGDKYYVNKSVAHDFCPSNLYGELFIESINIDGEEYVFNSIIRNTEPGVFDLIKLNKKDDVNDIQYVKLTIKCLDDEELIIKECEDDYSVTEKNMLCSPYKINDKKELEFNFWIPGEFELTVNQYCSEDDNYTEEDLNDNFTNEIVKVPNGEPFHVYFNKMPLRFLLGRNEEKKLYNKNLYNYQDIKHLMKGWLELNNEKTYVFENINPKYETTWEDFVDVGLTPNDEYFDPETIKAMVLYKYDKIFYLCESCYVVDDYSTYVQEISHSGGKSPILYKGYYPSYEDATDENVPCGMDIDDKGKVFLEAKFPNVVSFNYTANINNSPTFNNNGIFIIPDPKLTSLNEYTVRPYKKGEQFKDGSGRTVYRYYNPLIEDNLRQGNYFAAFTYNGCLDENGNTKQNCVHKQIPFKAKVQATSLNEIINPADKYFRGLFIDKRLDYGFIIFTPYGGNEIDLGDGDLKWTTGRISGNTYNGVEMNYNNQIEYKMISGNENDNLEYYTVFNYEHNQTDRNDKINNVILNTDVTNKRYYKSEIKCGGKKYNIVDYMHGTGGSVKDITLESTINGYITTEYNDYPMIRGFDAQDLPANNKISYECSSCSYKIKTGVEIIRNEGTGSTTSGFTEEDNENFVENVTGVTTEAGGIDFDISCKNMINNLLPTLDDCAANNVYNVHFQQNPKIDFGSLHADGKGPFLSKVLDLSFKLLTDTNNDTHRQYTLVPWLFNVRRKDEECIVNHIKDVKYGKYKKVFPEENTKEVCRKIGEYIIEPFDVEGANPAKILLNYGRITDVVVRHNEEDRRFANLEKNGELLYDDTTDFKNTVFKKRIGIKDFSILSVCFIRNYINSLADNLTKEFSTIQFTTIFDVRQFELRCDEAYLTEVENMDGGGGSGNTTGGTEQATVKETRGDDKPTPGTEAGKVIVQYAKYVIELNNNCKFNHEFEDFTKISARLRIDKQTINNIIINKEIKKDKDGNVVYQYELDENGKPDLNKPIYITDKYGNPILDENGKPKQKPVEQIAFHTYWSGDLSGKFLSNKKRKIGEDGKPIPGVFEPVKVKVKEFFDVALFIQMPSKLIYKIDFRHYGKDNVVMNPGLKFKTN